METNLSQKKRTNSTFKTPRNEAVYDDAHTLPGQTPMGTSGERCYYSPTRIHTEVVRLLGRIMIQA